MMLQARDLRWNAGGQAIVDQASLAVAPGECLGLIGPNGSGKSSLLRMLYRSLRPESGSVFIDGRDAWRMTARDFARQAAALPQEAAQGLDFSVREAVMMGRIPHQSSWAADSALDHAQVDRALEQVGMQALAARAFSSLSGGEKQRVLLARALAQQPRLLLLDEPTNHLDVGHQFGLLGLVRRMGVASIIALHDLNLAARYCHRLCLMQAGRIVAQGRPEEVLTPQTVQRVYGVAADIDTHAATGRLRITFVPDDDV
jgi:iron complex transport system ATP-binding protein